MPSVFGEISGVPAGRLFPNRAEVRAAGLHRHLQSGISGHPDEGADAIIVSGGYKDDQDYGDRIVYTGEGGRDSNTGRQIGDQSLTGGNKGLVVSEAEGLPVRVIRGAKGDRAYSPAAGYRYDGLFSVVRHWVEPSVDGPLIFRYELEKLHRDGEWAHSIPGVRSGDNAEAAGSLPAGNPVPDRQASVVQRLVRNSAVTQSVKALYNYTCQFCGVRLALAAGAYAEGAHIRPLGGVHRGADSTENVLCLCPNDHVLFDKGALFVDEHRNVVEVGSRTVRARLVTKHYVNDANFAYHRESIVT